MQTVKIREIKNLLKLGKKVQINTPDGWVDVLGYVDKGVSISYVLHYDGGRINGVTLNHRIETSDGWKEVGDLVSGDLLLTKEGFKSFYHCERYVMGKLCDINVGHPNHRFYADGVSVHNCDGSNTLALFRYFITEYSDLFKNMTLMNLDAKALDCTLVFNRRGFPANKDYMYKALTDTMRRVALLQESLIAICEELGFETDDIYISKTQAISRQLINVYASNFKEFVKRRTNVDIDIYDDETSRQKFVNAVQEDLDITIKVEFLKSSGALKMTHSMDVHNLKDLQENAESVRWLNPRTAEKISELCTVLLEASSVLQNANTYYTPFLNGLTFDDTGYYKLPVNLKFASTITTRYANAKGKPSRIFVNAMKTKTTYPLVLDNGLSGVNAQGLPSGQYNTIKAKRILDVKSLGKTVYNELMRREPDIQDDVYFKLMS